MDDNKPLVLTKPNEIQAYALLAIKHAMKLEMKGFKVTRGPSAFAIAKKRFGLKGNKEKVYADYIKFLNDEKGIETQP